MDESTYPSLREQCEAIAEHWTTVHEKPTTGRDIFDSDPSGHLWHIGDWYDEVLIHTGKPLPPLFLGGQRIR